MHCLQRVDQHTGDVAARVQYLQGAFAEVRQGVDIIDIALVADARLYPVPPAVIGATQPHQMCSPRVVASEADSLHHCLGARHMKRDLVQSCYPRNPLHGVPHHRVIGAQHRPEPVDDRRALVDAFLVKIVAEHVHAIGAREIVAPVAVEVAHAHVCALFYYSGLSQRLRK